MRGGQYLNNWRMAELHAKESPDRVTRARGSWGALFDRTPDGRILQRNFGGHAVPPAGARGRPHRPRDDPDAPGPRHPSGHGRAHGSTRSRRLLKDGGPGGRRLRVRPGAGTLHASSRLKSRSCSPRGGWARAFRITSNSLGVHGRRSRPRVPRRRRAPGHGVRPVPPHWDGVAAERPGILVTEGVRGEGGILKNSEGRAVHVRRHPRRCTSHQTADNPEEGWRYVHGRSETRAGRPSFSRATTLRARS